MITVRFRQADGEFARAWLTEYFRLLPWGPVRVVFGPLLVALGVQFYESAFTDVTRAISALVIGYGVYSILRPFLTVAALVRRRRAEGRAELEMEIAIDDDGLHIVDARSRTSLPWDAITAAGFRKAYFWFEVRRASKGTIPRRAIPDAQALEALFRARGKM